MKTVTIAGILLVVFVSVATGIDIYQEIQVFIPGENVCEQKLGLTYRLGDSWLPVVNGTIYLSEDVQCITDTKGYCNITVERDKVYAVKHGTNTVKLFIGCQEIVIVIRV